MTRQKDKTESIIESRRNARGDVEGFLMNYTLNLSRSARLMHDCLRVFKGNKDNLSQAMRCYIVDIAACLETFYHDALVFVYKNDPKVMAEAIEKLNDRRKLADLLNVINGSIGWHEYLAVKSKLQGLGEIEGAMCSVFGEGGYLRAIDDASLNCTVMGVGVEAFQIKEIDKDWRTKLAKLFELRHTFAHDANAPLTLKGTEMATIETVAVLLPQITAILIAEKYKGLRGFRNSETGGDLLLTIHELIATDWMVDTSGSDGGVKMEWSSAKIGIEVENEA